MGEECSINEALRNAYTILVRKPEGIAWESYVLQGGY
jgi:hypothetical protein